MGATTGSTTLDFGSVGIGDAVKVITGQAGILATSYVEAMVRGEASADHSVDEHLIESLEVRAGDIIPGVGFTIYGQIREGSAYGLYNVDWVWVS